MILGCPSCRARYVVPPQAFASGGRKVRCARCRHEWYATPPRNIDVVAFSPTPAQNPYSQATEEPVPAPDAVAAPAHATPNLPALIKNFAPWAAIWGKISGITGAIVKKIPARFILIGLATLMVLLWPFMYHDALVKAFPDIRGFFQTFGLDVAHSGEGLVFDQVKSELRYDSGTMRLFVDGVIHNTTHEKQLIPDIRARALGPDKSIIQSWWIAAPAVTVKAGDDVPFHSEMNAPMQQTIEDVSLEFYAEEDKSGVTDEPPQR